LGLQAAKGKKLLFAKIAAVGAVCPISIQLKFAGSDLDKRNADCLG